MEIQGPLPRARHFSRGLRAGRPERPPADPGSCNRRAAAWTPGGGSGAQLRRWRRWPDTWTRTCALRACIGCSQQRSAHSLPPAVARALRPRVGGREPRGTVNGDCHGPARLARGVGEGLPRETRVCQGRVRTGQGRREDMSSVPGRGRLGERAPRPGIDPRPRAPQSLTARPAPQRALHAPHCQLQHLGVLQLGLHLHG